MSMVLNHLRPDNAVLLVVDVQDKLLPAIHEADTVVEYARRMIEAAKVLGLPILAAEQYPEGLGHMCAILREALGEVRPVEVKSGTAGRLRSLHMLLRSYPNCARGYVFSSAPYAELPEERLVFLPLYYAYAQGMTGSQATGE